MVDMGDAIAAMDAARLRFEAEARDLQQQREALAVAEAAAREAESAAHADREKYLDIADRLLAIEHMEFNGHEARIDFRLPHFAAGVLAWSLCDSLGDAKNYVETYFRHPDGDHVIAVTIQRKEGKRPAEMVAEMRTVMQRMLDHDRVQCPWCGCWANGRDEHDDDCPVHRARELTTMPSNVPGMDLPVPT